MADINNVVLTGRLGRDPELRNSSGFTRCHFSLAVAGRKKDATDWVSCVVWGKLAETMCTYCHKGSRIGVTGCLRVSSYQDDTGKTKTVTDVNVLALTFLDNRRDNNSNNGYVQQQGVPAPAFDEYEIYDSYEETGTCDAELPF